MGRKAPALARRCDPLARTSAEPPSTATRDPPVPEAVGHLIGVALHVTDPLEVEPEPLRHELAEHGLVSLTVRVGTDGNRGGPGGVERDIGPLVGHPGRLLDGVGDTQPPQTAGRLGPRAARREAFDIDGGERLVHVALELAAVVSVARTRSGTASPRAGSGCTGAAPPGRCPSRAPRGRSRVRWRAPPPGAPPPGRARSAWCG